jgi:hypothetical protein
MTAAKATPKSAVRGRVLQCIADLRVAADLAEIGANGAEPENGAEHIVGVFDEMREELKLLRAAVRASYVRHPAPHQRASGARSPGERVRRAGVVRS